MSETIALWGTHPCLMWDMEGALAGRAHFRRRISCLTQTASRCKRAIRIHHPCLKEAIWYSLHFKDITINCLKKPKSGSYAALIADSKVPLNKRLRQQGLFQPCSRIECFWFKIKTIKTWRSLWNPRIRLSLTTTSSLKTLIKLSKPILNWWWRSSYSKQINNRLSRLWSLRLQESQALKLWKLQ